MQLQNFFKPIVDLIPFLGSFINSHEIKIGLPTFAPFFHHFFKTKYFFQKLKALERDKVVFHFYFFFSKYVGDYTVLLSSCIPKKSCTKSVIFFLYYYHCFLDSKMRFHFTFFIQLFFLFINISSCKMICNSFFSLVKL